MPNPEQIKARDGALLHLLNRLYHLSAGDRSRFFHCGMIRKLIPVDDALFAFALHRATEIGWCAAADAGIRITSSGISRMERTYLDPEGRMPTGSASLIEMGLCTTARLAERRVEILAKRAARLRVLCALYDLQDSSFSTPIALSDLQARTGLDEATLVRLLLEMAGTELRVERVGDRVCSAALTLAGQIDVEVAARTPDEDTERYPRLASLPPLLP